MPSCGLAIGGDTRDEALRFVLVEEIRTDTQ